VRLAHGVRICVWLPLAFALIGDYVRATLRA
jgi:hypothetical protein